MAHSILFLILPILIIYDVGDRMTYGVVGKITATWCNRTWNCRQYRKQTAGSMYAPLPTRRAPATATPCGLMSLVSIVQNFYCKLAVSRVLARVVGEYQKKLILFLKYMYPNSISVKSAITC